MEKLAACVGVSIAIAYGLIENTYCQSVWVRLRFSQPQHKRPTNPRKCKNVAALFLTAGVTWLPNGVTSKKKKRGGKWQEAESGNKRDLITGWGTIGLTAVVFGVILPSIGTIRPRLARTLVDKR